MQPNGKGAIIAPTEFLTAKTGVKKTVLHRLVDDHIISGAISTPPTFSQILEQNASVLFFDRSSSVENDVLIGISRIGEEYKEGAIQKTKLLPNEIELIAGAFNNRENTADLSFELRTMKLQRKAIP